MSDLIRRQDAIDVVEKYFSETLSLNSDICTDGIRSLPSAQSERKKGKWIKISITDDGYAVNFRCSCCKESDVKYQWKYCPNCGADMRGETNEAD